MKHRMLEFSPTLEELSDFQAYISKLEKLCAAKGGACLIHPPDEWKQQAMFSPEELEARMSRLVLESPICQRVRRVSDDSFFIRNVIETPLLNLQEFHDKYASVNRELTDEASLRERFWEEMGKRPMAIYGADSPGSLFKESCNVFNLGKLSSPLDLLNQDIRGVTSPFIYAGSWKSCFSLHTEDMDLASINFLHHGAPKIWNAVDPSDQHRVTQLAAQLFPNDSLLCSEFLRHKQYLLHPHLLERHGIPVYGAMQRPGDFVVAFCGTFHFGFNTGFNLAEAVNFATARWLHHARVAESCQCSSHSVYINVDLFLAEYVPHLRRTGALPPVDPQAEWTFKCHCGLYCSSSDPPEYWPQRKQFECSHCKSWMHSECYLYNSDPPLCLDCAEKGIARSNLLTESQWRSLTSNTRLFDDGDSNSSSAGQQPDTPPTAASDKPQQLPQAKPMIVVKRQQEADFPETGNCQKEDGADFLVENAENGGTNDIGQEKPLMIDVVVEDVLDAEEKFFFGTNFRKHSQGHDNKCDKGDEPDPKRPKSEIDAYLMFTF